MSLLRAASSISVLTLVSRVLGLARDILMAHVVGTAAAAGTFVLAWMVPNLLRRLFGEGALSAAFIPAYAKRRDRDGPAAATDLLAGVSGALVVGIGVLIAGLWAASWLLPADVWHLAGDETMPAADRNVLMWDLLRLLFPYALPICLLAVYAGALNAAGVFAAPAAAPVVLNVCWIAALWWADGAIGSSDAVSLTGASSGGVPQILRVVAWALLIGGFLQLVLVVVPLRRRGLLAMPRLPRPGDGTGAVFGAMLPAALGLSVVQINLLLDQALADFLVGPGANTHLYFANRLLLFPHALLALPLATAMFPRLASITELAERRQLRDSLGRAVRYTLFTSVPAAVGMAAVAGALVDVTLVGGRYTSADAEITTAATICLVASLPALGVVQLYARALFALGDTRAPARASAMLVLVNLALNLTFVLGFGLGVEGFTLATTCSAYLNVLLLRRALLRRDALHAIGWSQLGRIAAASTAMLAVLIGLRLAFDGDGAVEGAGRWRIAVFGLVLPITCGAAAYWAAAAWFRVRELGELADWWRRRRAAHSTRSNSK